VLSRIIVLNIWIFECTRWRLFQKRAMRTIWCLRFYYGKFE